MLITNWAVYSDLLQYHRLVCRSIMVITASLHFVVVLIFFNVMCSIKPLTGTFYDESCEECMKNISNQNLGILQTGVFNVFTSSTVNKSKGK